MDGSTFFVVSIAPRAMESITTDGPMVYNRHKNMKKLILSVIAFASLTGIQAQNPITPIDYDGYFWSVLPRLFCNETYALSLNGEEVGYDVDTAFIINSNLQIEKTIPFNMGERNNRPVGPVALCFYNYATEIMYDYVRFYFSQTLFNSDNKFEYIKPVYSSSTTVHGCNVERLEILSDDGTTVNTISWEDGYLTDAKNGVYLYNFGNKLYLRVSLQNLNNNTQTSAWYRIDRQTQSIARVENVPFNVFPTVVDRSSEITVQLEEGTIAHEIVVVDAMGREVKSVPVQPGQREVKVCTSGLHAGPGFLTDRKNGTVKIIVR